jgi:hypothetical protein
MDHASERRRGGVVTLIVQCNLCRRIIADDDADAVRCGEGPKGRTDLCGACMREAAERVLERLRASVRVVDPVPQTVQRAALSVRLPERLRRNT